MIDFYSAINAHKNEIQDIKWEVLATDPTGGDLYEARFWYNSTDKRFRFYDGTSVLSAATLTDLASIGAFQGVHDASGGAVPATRTNGDPIVAGDFWRISVAGTIAGIGGDDALEVGDLIFANISGTPAAADWTGVQVNLDLPATLAQVEEVTLATLTANTATAVPTTFTNAYSVQVFDSSDNEIILDIAGPSTARTVEASEALSNIKIVIVGN